MHSIIFTLLVTVLIGGGASLVAQNALPGDLLWGFKINVNEKIESAFSPGAKAQAYFDIMAIKARLEEAEKLAADSKLTADVRAEIQENLDTHFIGAQQNIAALEAKNNYAIAAEMATRLQTVIATQMSGPLDLREALDKASSLSSDMSTKAELY